MKKGKINLKSSNTGKTLILAIGIFLFNSCIALSQVVNSWSQIVGNTLGQPGLLGYYYINTSNSNLVTFVPGNATGVIQFAAQVSLNVDDLPYGYLLPLVIPPGVTLLGDYDQMNNPEGTVIFSKKHRYGYSLNHDKIYHMYIFALEPALTTAGTGSVTSIKNINLRGPNPSTDLNIGSPNSLNGFDNQYCGGIIIPSPHYIGIYNFNGTASNYYPSNTYGYNYEISGCQISGFNHTGIFVDNKTDKILIQNCFINHIKENHVKGSGYSIYADMKVDPASYQSNVPNISIANCLFDDTKNSMDATSHSPFNLVYKDNTTTQTSGGINRHNNYGMYYPYNGQSGDFYHELYGDCVESECIAVTQGTPFGIDDCSPGDILVEHNIFNSGRMSFPFPGNYSYEYIPSTQLLQPGAAAVTTLFSNGNANAPICSTTTVK